MVGIEYGQSGMDAQREIFIGRSEQLAALAEVAAKAATGEPWLILIEGESGVGKTALIRRFLHQLDQFMVLAVSADPHEADFPGSVLGQLLSRIDAVQLRPYPLLVGDLETATPFAVGGQLIGLLGELEALRPVAVVVDDAQWLDDFSMQTLLFVLRRLWHDRVLMLMATRASARQGQESQLRSFGRHYERAVHVRLEGLDRAEIAELAGVMLGPAGAGEELVNQLQARTGGRALYLRTLMSEVPVQRLAQNGDLPTSPSLAAAIQGVLAGIPPESRALVEAMAVLDARAPLHIAAGLAGLNALAATGALGPLLNAGLVEWWPHEAAAPVAIRHSIQRDTIYALLSPADLQRLHSGAAMVVGGAKVWAHRVAAAAGAPAPDLADQLESAAADESSRGQNAIAATHMRWAAELSPTRTEREWRLIRAYFCVQLSGQIGRQLAYREELEACSPGTLRDLALACLTATLGEHDALQLAQRVWRAVSAHPNPAELIGYVSYVLPGSFMVRRDPLTAIEICRWVLDVGGLDGERLSGTRSILALSTLVLAGPRIALQTIAETAGEASEISPENVQLIAVRGSLKVLDGQLEQGLADLVIALRYAREGRPIIVGRRIWAFTRWARFLAGRWDESLLSVADAAREAGSPIAWYDLAYEDLSRIWVLAARGDTIGGQRQLDQINEASRLMPGAGEHLCHLLGRAIMAQARGDHKAMYEAVGPLRDSPVTSYEHMQTARWWLPLLAEAEAGTDRLGEAEKTLLRLGDVADVPYLFTQVARLRAWIAEQRGDLAAALAICEQTASVASSPDDAPFFRARLLLEYGRLLRSAGHRRRASEQLHMAHAVFAGLGATPFVQQCREELTRAGLHAPRQRTRYATQLTEREREVANLVAMGDTNREISAELFLSVKAIEYHLTNIYIKLNLSGRRALRDFVQHEARAS